MSPFHSRERAWMARALELAWLGRDGTHPNPRVGCVLVRDGEVVGEGWHRRAGEPHAEAFALDAAGARARGATAYVTLEPCNHHGRTPPCTEALLAAGVARVVYAVPDPDPRVDGGGAARLRAAGVDVVCGLLAEEATELNLGFFSRLRRGRPWVRLKLAASLDGRTALAGGESQWITSEAARQDVQCWRAQSAAILTGVGTVLADDPALTVRVGDSPRQPLRVVLDGRLRSPPAARVFSGPGESLVFALEDADAGRFLPPSRVALERVSAGSDGRLALPEVLRRLGARQLNEAWVEAGPTLAGSLLAAGLVDELVLYLAPTLLGPDARPLAMLPALSRLADRPAWRIHDLRPIGPDARIMLRPGGQ
ncbi:MAG: bifunctional diaminohydroxyphosphoribosylaminopyrimidine deaminase/5-amino-6-(5-phosphoribosylamino)uracil reductase RibD [Steroidobacteraceae bacterium]|jgi:diaminohydroxyphosphoribosylaminopyrimidine deaminase/5-amino-6-(5-phosphoribosylamino)uracil reductase|nr:bifunctional diaminohydroxyphosphoribosylaminopyrimidine deaminase/5-amino-6-(5-phosphoribosylamino)uracil reductase RibD [Steroidobacteraceae bacterium]